MASLQGCGSGVIIEHKRGPQPRGPDPHLHAQVEQPRVPVPHPELAEQCSHHLLGAGTPRHREGLVFYVRS